MRPFEIILFILLGWATINVFYSPHERRHSKLLLKIIFSVFLIHLFLEQSRWQMFPAYTLIGGILLIQNRSINSMLKFIFICLFVFLLGLGAFFVGLVLGGVVIMFFSGSVYALCQKQIRWLAKNDQEKEWEEMSMATVTQGELNSLAVVTEKYCAKQNTLAFYDEAVKRRIMLAPLSTTEQLLKNPQLNAREAFVDVQHPELGTAITYPGPWTRFSKSPLVFNRRAPLIGEHNDEIYGEEMGMSKEQVTALKGSGVI